MELELENRKTTNDGDDDDNVLQKECREISESERASDSERTKSKNKR